MDHFLSGEWITFRAARPCSLASATDAPISTVIVPFVVEFQSSKATVRERTIRVSIPSTLNKGSPFKFYLIDDSEWSPSVTLPTEGQGRLPNEAQNRAVTIESATGQPGARPKLWRRLECRWKQVDFRHAA